MKTFKTFGAFCIKVRFIRDEKDEGSRGGLLRVGEYEGIHWESRPCPKLQNPLVGGFKEWDKFEEGETKTDGRDSKRPSMVNVFR